MNVNSIHVVRHASADKYRLPNHLQLLHEYQRYPIRCCISANLFIAKEDDEEKDRQKEVANIKRAERTINKVNNNERTHGKCLDIDRFRHHIEPK